MNTITPMDSVNQEVWIGVDVGTTGVRAIAYTEEGVNICSSEAFYPLLTPRPDWAEESPLQILGSEGGFCRAAGQHGAFHHHRIITKFAH